ncbi:MAG: DUF4097 domain-containing protein [Oscillospiraceae bacterium]|nr:DUF4097 domain-containing protein [Oscillospiraceae bacterium]
MNLKFSKVYWMISAALILSGFAFMTAGVVRAESDREKHLTRQEKVFADISKFEIALAEGKVSLEKDPEITECKVEITSISDTIQINSQDETLQIQDKRKQPVQFLYFGFLHPVSTEIKITVPERAYQQANIKINTGDCSVSGLQMEELWMDSDIGNCTVADCEIQTLQLETSTGDVELKHCEILEHFTLDSDVGTVRAENLSCAGETIIKLSTGDCQIENSIFSGAVKAESDVGSMDLHNITLDGSLQLDADTGDVSVSMNGREEDFALECSSDIGSVIVNQQKTGNIRNSISDTDQRSKIIISTDVGSIDLYFLGNH